MIKVKGDGRFGPMIYMDNDLHVGQSVEKYGEYSYPAVDLLARLVAEDDVVVDVGAHIGTFTVPMARLVPKGYVIAFEAQPVVFNILCGNVAINNLFNVTTAQRAVSDNDGMPLYIPEYNYATHSQDYAAVKLLKERAGNLSMMAHTIKVDSLGLAKCKILKITTNENELAVLKGATETIKRATPIIFLSRGDQGTTSYLEGLGYTAREYEFPMFNAENHAKSSENIFGEKTLKRLFCYPSQAEASLKPLFEMPFFTGQQQEAAAAPSVPPVECPYKPAKENLSVEAKELTLELPKIFAEEK